MKNLVKRIICLAAALAVITALTACTPKENGEETVSDASKAESEASSEISEESEETAETSEASSEETESGGTDLPDGLAEVTHAAHWGLREYEGFYQIEIEIESKGAPIVPGSAIKFTVKDTIHDYKVYDALKCQGELVADKNLYPDMVDKVYGGDGIYGFPGDWFSWDVEEGEADADGRMIFAFCHKDVNGNLKEDTVTWEKDGTLSVNNGVITEITDMAE